MYSFPWKHLNQVSKHHNKSWGVDSNNKIIWKKSVGDTDIY